MALNAMSAAQVRSIGKRDCGNLFKLGDDMIQFGGLHALLAASVADMLPVNVGLLLSDDAKRQSRAATAAKRQASGALGHEDAVGTPKSFEGLMNSPWKVGVPFFYCQHALPLQRPAAQKVCNVPETAQGSVDIRLCPHKGRMFSATD